MTWPSKMNMRGHGADQLVCHKEGVAGNALMSSALPQGLLHKHEECDSGSDCEVPSVGRWQVTLDFSLGSVLFG